MKLNNISILFFCFLCSCDYGGLGIMTNATNDTVLVTIGNLRKKVETTKDFFEYQPENQYSKNPNTHYYKLCPQKDAILIEGLNGISVDDLNFDTLIVVNRGKSETIIGRTNIRDKFIYVPKTKYIFKYSIYP